MNFYRFYRFILHSDSDNKSFHFMFVRWTTSLLPNVKFNKSFKLMGKKLFTIALCLFISIGAAWAQNGSWVKVCV